MASLPWTWLAVLVSALGIALHKWAHAGHRNGDSVRRRWAGPAGVVVAVVGGAGALVLAVVT